MQTVQIVACEEYACKGRKKSAARVSAVQEMLRWHCPPEWTVLFEAQEGEGIHTTRTQHQQV